jgi:catechol 2,3-dioxygenase-like lactoylglutathione lyase family enzyme
LEEEQLVKNLKSILCVMVLGSLAILRGQVPAPNYAGVALGHLDTNVSDVEAAKKFWTLLGGKAIKIDGTDVMKFPGVLIFVRKGDVSGGTEGTTFDHAGFWVPNGQEFVRKLKAAGVRADATAGAPRRPDYHGYSWGDVYSPDGLKVEILEDKNLTVPIEIDHIHLFGSNSSSEAEIQAWYRKTFDARLILDPVPNATKPVVAAMIGDVEFKFTKSTDVLAPTHGRAMERFGFEVKNLEAFCKRLEAGGVKFDKPYSKYHHASHGRAEIIDPWGTPIELTEGLSRF